MRHIISITVLLLNCISTLIAQVEVDKPIHLNGASDNDRAVTNLALPVNDGDAANKKYVDDQIAANSGGGSAHYISELYGGGVIIDLYTDENGNEHGRILSLVDNSSGAAWSNVTSSEIGVPAQNYFNGASNSAAIIGQAGHTSSAAKICDDYVTGDYGDWYLPALWELGTIWDNIGKLRISLLAAGATEIAGGWYWSSTELSDTNVKMFSFSSSNAPGEPFNSGKGSSRGVRCVRVF